MKALFVELAVVVIVGVSSYTIGRLQGAEGPKKELAARDALVEKQAKNIKRANKTIDNLIVQTLNPLPEAPRVKEVIKYVRVKESATNQCLNNDTVRMLNSIRRPGRQLDDPSGPAATGTAAGTPAN